MKFTNMGQLMTSLVLTTAIAGMVACGKKNEDSQGISNGTVKTDGAVVSSSSTLAGYGMNVVVSGFKPNSTTNGLINQGFNNGFNSGFNNGYNNGGYSTISSTPQVVTFELRINSDVRNISVSVNNNTVDTLGNNSFNQFNGQFNNGYYNNQNSNYINSAQTTIGGALVQTTGACYQSTYSCDEVALSVILNLGSEYKQIGIRYNLRTNRIVNVRDYQGGQSVIRDALQLTREM